MLAIFYNVTNHYFAPVHTNMHIYEQKHESIFLRRVLCGQIYMHKYARIQAKPMPEITSIKAEAQTSVLCERGLIGKF